MRRERKSSRTRLSVTQSNIGVSSMCCSSLPGVHTSTFILFTVSFSSFTFFPPMSSPALREWCFPAARSCWKICIASSLVGAMTSPPMPSCRPHFARYSDSRSGITNASVFPLPVFAAPRTSRPASACGIVARWMAVSSLNLASARPRCVGVDSGTSLNFLTPTSDAPRPFSLDFLGATASGFVPFSGFVACGTTERSEDGVG